MLYRNKITKNYEFPTISLLNGDTFSVAKQKLFLHLSKERFKLYYPNKFAIASVTRNFYEHELQDPKNKLLKGVRTYYFQGFHFRGIPSLAMSEKNEYDDFIFTPKNIINKHINKDYYDSIIDSLFDK